jgi:hypothetical protein
VSPAVENPNFVALGNLSYKADTARAQDAPLSVKDHMGADDFGLVALDLVLIHAAIVKAELHVIFLQIAFSGLIADRTIQRVINQQKLQNTADGLFNFVAISGDHHAFTDPSVTSRLEFGHFLDLHQAHPAGPGNGQPGVITVTGNLNS